MSGPDLRNARAQRTKHTIVVACRALMSNVTSWPTVPQIAERAGVSLRTIYERFDSLEHVYQAAIDDPSVRERIMRRILGEAWTSVSLVVVDRFVRALLFDESAPKDEPVRAAQFQPDIVVGQFDQMDSR